VYTRDGTSDKLTPDLLHQLVSSLWLVSAYYKMCKNPVAHNANVGLTLELYDPYKKMSALNNNVLATEAAYVPKKVSFFGNLLILP
jgi:hypothetical protein